MINSTVLNSSNNLNTLSKSENSKFIFTDLPINPADFSINTTKSKGDSNLNLNCLNKNNSSKLDLKNASNLSKFTSAILNAAELTKNNSKKMKQLEDQIKNKSGSFTTLANSYKNLLNEMNNVNNSDDLNNIRIMVINSCMMNNMSNQGIQAQRSGNPQIDKFIEITNVNIQTATQYLQQHNMNVEAAVSDFFNKGVSNQSNQSNQQQQQNNVSFQLGPTSQPN